MNSSSHPDPGAAGRRRAACTADPGFFGRDSYPVQPKMPSSRRRRAIAMWKPRSPAAPGRYAAMLLFCIAPWKPLCATPSVTPRKEARSGSNLQREPRNGAPVAVLQVSDSGPGVPEDALTKLFQPFYRLDEARGRMTGGVGLGLAITERAVVSWRESDRLQSQKRAVD